MVKETYKRYINKYEYIKVILTDKAVEWELYDGESKYTMKEIFEDGDDRKFFVFETLIQDSMISEDNFDNVWMIYKFKPNSEERQWVLYDQYKKEDVITDYEDDYDTFFSELLGAESLSMIMAMMKSLTAIGKQQYKDLRDEHAKTEEKEEV